MPRLPHLLFLAAVLGLSGCGLLSGDGAGTAEFATKSVVLDPAAAATAISRYRASHGLGPVTIDASLARAAADQAEVNARAGRLSHELGGAFPTRLARAGFGGRYAAENLGAGAETLDEALTRWKDSPEHNKNLLMPQVQRIGIARVDAPSTRYKRFWALVLSST